MKSLFLTCFLAFAASASAQQTATVTGQITWPTNDSIRVSYYTNLLDFTKVTTGAALKADGTFSVTVPLNSARAAFLEHNYEIIELYLQPGDQLHVTFDTQEIDETLQYTGQGANENTCLSEISRKYADDDDFNYSKKSVYANDAEYLKLVNGKFKWQAKFAEKYMNKNQVSEPFKKWLRSEIHFGSALQKLQYPELRSAVVKIDDPYKVSDTYYDFLETADDYPNPDLNSLCYINYKHELLKHLFRKQVTTDPGQPGFYSVQYNFAKSLLSGQPEAIITGRLVIESYKKGQVAYSDQMLADYKADPNNKAYKPIVQSTADFYRPLAKGNRAPALPMVDANGKPISLDSLKGKAVYLYFYTLGCGSCQMEVMGARALAEKLDDRNIAFVFVSVDHDRENWKKVVTRRPWPGITGQTVDSAAAVANYRLTQYPTAFIIDPNGRIYDKATKRLGTNDLQLTLEAVLNEKNLPLHGRAVPKQ